jgi:hemolysin III
LPEYRAAERIADGVIHVAGVVASLSGAAFLLVRAFDALPAKSVVSIIVYSAGIVAVFCFSAAYNLVSSRSVKLILRRFDQAAIYLKIAAVYTPFALVKMGGLAGLGLLTSVWAVAAFGLTAKLLFPGRLIKTGYVLYLAQGWAVVFALGPFAAAVSGTVLVLLGIGGLLYTVGVFFHLRHARPYHNAIWHGFVLIASGCHYVAVMSAMSLG